jgi:hypothetical protein
MLKIISKKLSSTRYKVSRSWQSYRTEKKKILRSRLSEETKKEYLQHEREKRYERISNYYKNYREVKHGLLYKSEFPDFSFSKNVRTPNTNQKFYIAKRTFDTDKLDEIIPNILDQKNVKGVMVIQDVYNQELKHKSTVSKYITKENLNKTKGDIYSYMNENIFGLYQYRGYKMKNIQIRIIRANTQKT